MNITKRLLEKDPSLKLFNEGNWSDDYDFKKPGYTSFNDAGVEVEVGEFLYAIVRVLKPDHVLETGTHWGIGASYMGQALKDNGGGQLDTIEFLGHIYKKAVERIVQLELENHVACHLTDARLFTPENGTRYGLILLDTEPQTRFEEFVRYFDYLLDGGYIFIHDLHRHMHQIETEGHEFAWPFGKIPSVIKQWVERDLIRPFHFPTPRGLTGFYKPREDDYKWK